MTSEKLTILIETEMNWKEQALINSEWKERALDGLTTTKNLAITPPKNLLSALNLFAGKTLALCILLFFAEQVSSQALQRRMDDPELAKIKANRMAQLQVFVILISLNSPRTFRAVRGQAKMQNNKKKWQSSKRWWRTVFWSRFVNLGNLLDRQQCFRVFVCFDWWNIHVL